MTGTWRRQLGYLAPATLVGALAVVGPIEGGPTLCPFALCTGIACPGCGMTRAASHLIRGDVSGALGYHPLILLVAALSVIGTAWYLLRRMGKAGPIPNRPPPLRGRRPDIPSGMVYAVERALAKRPDDRWRSAAEFRDAMMDRSAHRAHVDPNVNVRQSIPVPPPMSRPAPKPSTHISAK